MGKVRYCKVDVPDGASGIRWQRKGSSRWVERTWRRVLLRGGFLGHEKKVPANVHRVQYLSFAPTRWERISTMRCNGGERSLDGYRRRRRRRARK